jgi:hypothetical protein
MAFIKASEEAQIAAAPAAPVESLPVEKPVV